MPEVIFYVLPSESQTERLQFACKLIEKIYRNGQFCYVLTDTAQQSQLIDDLLWTFRAGSFVPHEIFQGQSPEFDNLVLIGSDTIPEKWLQVVINLSATIPQQFKQCGKILEILDNSEATKQMGRERYRQYKQAQLEIITHKL